MIYLVRHGETEWSRTHRHTGRTDIPLNDAGREQARRLGARLAGRDWALVLSSPLARAADTARLAGVPGPELVDDLMEWDYGAVEGRTADDFRAEHPGWSLWTDGGPGGESPAAVAERADRVIARVTAVDGDVLLFAHGHLLRVLVARWLGQPPQLGEAFLLGTGAVCELAVHRGRRAIESWNMVS